MRFVAGRLARSLLALLVCSFLVFASLEIVPGGPVAAVTRGRVLSEEDRQQIVQLYGLDRPFLERYWDWLTGVLHGDLGRSLSTRETVTSTIADHLPTTIALVLYAATLVCVFGLLIGAYAAWQGGLPGNAVTSVAAALTATPAFVAGILLVTLFGVWLDWFPTFGAGEGLTGTIYHLTLPALALALAAVGYVIRLVKTSVSAEASRDHVAAAVSRGLPRRHVRRHHVYRNAALPVVTGLGTAIAGLFVATVVVEDLFGLSGLGSLLVRAVLGNDFPVIQGVVLVMVTVFVVFNLVVDLAYPALDPRVRSEV